MEAERSGDVGTPDRMDDTAAAKAAEAGNAAATTAASSAEGQSSPPVEGMQVEGESLEPGSDREGSKDGKESQMEEDKGATRESRASSSGGEEEDDDDEEEEDGLQASHGQGGSRPEDSSDTGDSSDDAAAQAEGSQGAKKKKKKKKKKKNKGKSANEGSEAAAVNSSDEGMLPADVAESRYVTALEGLRSKSDLCLWVQLSKCRLSDKKARKISDALAENKSVTSIDLSHNSITDEGIQLLSSALLAGAAPDLIQLDLRGNPLTDRGRALLLSLESTRKQVKVELAGESGVAEAAALGERSNSGSGASEWSESSPRNEWQHSRPEANGAWAGADGSGRSAAKERKKAVGTPQDRIEAVLAAIRINSGTGAPNVAELTSRLEDAVAVIMKELQEDQHKIHTAHHVDNLPPGLKLVTKNLLRFISVFDMNPPPLACPRSTTLEPSVGRHRIALIELLHRLAIPCHRKVDEQLEGTSAVKLAVGLVFRFPWSSILHSAATRLLEVILSRPESSLASSLLIEGDAGLAARLAREGSAAVQVHWLCYPFLTAIENALS
eukprot:TRINITY_DN8076_c0_g1_i1.p1 TRINITY_DN8076_c0_g1~~TRINITY_DN8076_c0_g1_i1.p1  ORF type:complete len:554 (-),score=135.87 TRINITY_DN8076_c0_g1_i1:575-2236(-)